MMRLHCEQLRAQRIGFGRGTTLGRPVQYLHDISCGCDLFLVNGDVVHEVDLEAVGTRTRQLE